MQAQEQVAHWLPLAVSLLNLVAVIVGLLGLAHRAGRWEKSLEGAEKEIELQRHVLDALRTNNTRSDARLESIENLAKHLLKEHDLKTAQISGLDTRVTVLERTMPRQGAA